MALNDITRKAVERAIEECDKIGEDKFLRKYKSSVKRYIVKENSKNYPAKCLLRAAHDNLFPHKAPFTFRSGETTTVAMLEKLGFDVKNLSGETAGASHGTAL